MDDGNWTLVVRRRAPKLRTSVSETTTSDSSKHRGRAPKAPPLQARREDQECDEALLLLKMKRSMVRIQESSFFKMLIDQVQSPPVLNNLHRAASASGFDIDHEAHGSVSDEGKILANLGSHIFAPASTHNSQDIVLQVRSSTEDSMLECACALLRIPCVNCKASKAVAKACTFKDCSNVECESLREACGKKMPYESAQSNLVTKAMSNCKSCIRMDCETLSDGSHDEEAACSVTHGEFTNGLTRMDGIEVCMHLTMKQRPCPQINEKPWCLQVVLYGLGSIADSEISRCQLALILLLKQRFAWVGDVEVYDPVLSQSERKVMADMGCLPIAVDEKGSRSISRPTLFYMPHCEDWLYDNVLQANWVPHTLHQLVILGNSFQDYQERWSSPIGGKSKPPFHVIQYQQVAQEIPLKATSSPDLPGFNNLSWHFYPLPDKGNCI